MNKEPTQEEIKRLWRWCGLSEAVIDELLAEWHHPDLNSLFEWAVPQVLEKIMSDNETMDLSWARWFLLTRFLWEWNEEPKKPELALFWAINKIIDNSPPW
jgi:hypothetical protein